MKQSYSVEGKTDSKIGVSNNLVCVKNSYELRWL